MTKQTKTREAAAKQREDLRKEQIEQLEATGMRVMVSPKVLKDMKEGLQGTMAKFVTCNCHHTKEDHLQMLPKMAYDSEMPNFIRGKFDLFAKLVMMDLAEGSDEEVLLKMQRIIERHMTLEFMQQLFDDQTAKRLNRMARGDGGEKTLAEILDALEAVSRMQGGMKAN